MKKQGFLQGAAVLAAASVLCKIMSAVFKIPLDRFFLHEEGIAVYQSAYSVYNVFLAIFVAGVSLALSKVVAQSDEKDRASVCASTCALVSAICFVCALALIAVSNPLARLLSGGEEAVAAPALRMLAPGIMVMGLISSRRGFFQGNGDMTPTALSNIAESFIKVILGIGICALTVKKGIAYGASGAIGGVCAGALTAALLLEVLMRRAKREKAKLSLSAALHVLKLSVPMTLGAFAFTGVMLADTLTVGKALAINGLDITVRLKMFGYLTRANTIYNLPATIITAFSAGIVPAISSQIAKKDEEGISGTVQKALKIVFLVAFPAGVGMAVFSKEILSLLYNSSVMWQLIAFGGAMAIVMPYVQTSTAMLQSVGRVWAPIWISAGALALKVVLNFVFIRFFGITGAPLSTLAVFVPSAIINTILLCKETRPRGAGKVIAKMALCALCACALARVVYKVGEGTLMFFAALFVAAVVYVGAIFLWGCIKKEELKG